MTNPVLEYMASAALNKVIPRSNYNSKTFESNQKETLTDRSQKSQKQPTPTVTAPDSFSVDTPITARH